MKRFFKLLFVAFVLQCAVYAAVDIRVETFPGSNGIYIGDTQPVIIFHVSGNVSSGGLQISIGNNSTNVPFGHNGVSDVELRYSANLNELLSGGGASAGTRTSVGSGSVPYIFSGVNSGTGYYSVKYAISKAANYSDNKNNPNIGANLSLAIKDGQDDINISNPYASQLIPVLATGLIYLPTELKSMLKTEQTIAAKAVVPMLQFELRAEENTINIRNITLLSDGNFATNPDVGGGKVVEITILADDGDYMYGGIEREITVFKGALPQNDNDDKRATLILSQPVTLSPYVMVGGSSNRKQSQRIFYILYRLGDAPPLDGSTLSCRLGGAEGIVDGDADKFTYLNVDEEGVGSAVLTVKHADARLVEEETMHGDDIGTMVLGGQSRVNMLKFTYDVSRRIDNVTIQILNEGGNFLHTDNGITRVYLYEDNRRGDTDQAPPSLVAIGEVSSNAPEICTFREITMHPGMHKYYVEYDVGVLVTANSYEENGVKIDRAGATAQLLSISAPNAGFSGYLPAPAAPYVIYMYPSQIWMDYVSTNVKTVNPGQTFQVDIALRNIVNVVTNPGYRNLDIVETTRPVFYTSDIAFGNADEIKGTDISSQFEITYIGPPSPAGSNYIGPRLDQRGSAPGPENATIFSFEVRAKDSLQYKGQVFIDGYAVYDTRSYNPGMFIRTVRYGKHFDYIGGTKLRSAAADYVSSNMLTYAVIDVNGADSDSSQSDKSHVEAIYYEAEDGIKSFVPGDQLPTGKDLFIRLKSDYLIEPEVFINIGGNTSKLSNTGGETGDYVYKREVDKNNNFVSNNVIQIYKHVLSGKSGVLTISGIRKPIADEEQHEGDAEEILVLPFATMSGGPLKITNLYPYPSPYNPDVGDLKIGFDCNEYGAKYTVNIYDATGRLVFTEADLLTEQGYNVYNWDGSFTSGKKVGRGAYILYVKFQGTRKQDIVTKFGVY